MADRQRVYEGRPGLAEWGEDLGEIDPRVFRAIRAGVKTNVAPDSSGVPFAGLLESTKSLPALPHFLGDLLTGGRYGLSEKAPGFALEASEKYDELLNKYLAEEGLGESSRLPVIQKFGLAAGEMLGQLPVPGKLLERATKKLPKAFKPAGWLAEYFGPTVDPKAVNYVIGTGVGGTLRTATGEEGPGQLAPGYCEGGYVKMADGGRADSERQAIVNQIRGTDWFKEFVKQYGEEPDLSENADYDYMTAWKAGIRPRINPNDQRYHWDSKTPDGRMLKKPDHPTIWKTYFMDATGIDPDAIGLKSEQQAQEWLKQNPIKKADGGAVETDYTKYNDRILRALIKRYGSEARAREVMRTTDGGELLRIMLEEESRMADGGRVEEEEYDERAIEEIVAPLRQRLEQFTGEARKVPRRIKQAAADITEIGPIIKRSNEIPLEYFDVSGEMGGEADAMRHLLFQAQLARKYGENPAKLISYLHEYTTFGQPESQREMDLYNDILGREIAAKAKSDEDLVRLAEKYVTSGRAKTLPKEQRGGY